MATKRYLVVHPRLVLGEPLKAGTEIDLEEAHAKALVSSGKLKLVVADKPKPKRKLTNGSKSKRQRSARNKAE